MSLVVLISSITFGGECSKTSNAKSHLNADAKNNFTADFELLRQQANTTNSSDDVEGFHNVTLPSDLATFPLNTTSSNLSNEKEEKSTSMPSTTMSPNTTSSTTAVHADHANNTGTESTSPTTDSPPPEPQEYCNAFLGRQHDFWDAKSDTYIILIQASSGTGIFVALLQLGFSWLLICGSGKVRFGTLYFMNHAYTYKL